MEFCRPMLGSWGGEPPWGRPLLYIPTKTFITFDVACFSCPDSQFSFTALICSHELFSYPLPPSDLSIKPQRQFSGKVVCGFLLGVTYGHRRKRYN